MQYAGALCGSCAKTYYIFDEHCWKCPVIPWGVIVMAALGLVGAYVFTKVDTGNWMIVAALKQLVNFSQNINITDLISVAWPDIYKKIMQVFKYFSTDLEGTAPECFTDGFNWHMRYLSTVGMFLTLFVVTWLGIKLTSTPRWFHTNQRLKRIIFFFFSACYATLATVCVKSFQSTDGGLFVYDTEIDFHGANHTAIMISAGILLILCLFGMPIGFAMFARQLLRSDRLRDPAIKNAFGNIYDAFKDSHVDFEAYSLLRRGLGVVTVVIGRNNSVVQATALMGLSLIYFLLVLRSTMTFR